MNPFKYPLLCAAVGLAVALGTATASEAAVLLNFTSTSHFTGDVPEAKISPGQQVGGISGSHWNKISSADTASLDIIDHTGAVLNGVSVDLGVAGSASTVIDYSVAPSSFSNLGTAWKTGVFSGNAQSGMFTSSRDDQKVGVRLSGLPAGTYTVYVTSLNTNSTSTNRYNIYAGAVDSASTNSDYSGFSFEFLDFFDPNTPKIIDAWVENINYVALTVTLGEDEDLVVVSDGLTSGEDRGFLNTVEVVLVPEPASLGLLGLGGLVLLRRRRG